MKMNAKSRLSKQDKRALARVEILLKYYQGGYKDEPLYYCPLCSLLCARCPWRILENEWCLNVDDNISEKREHPPARWRTASIKRLTRWVRLIKDGTYDKRLKEAKP
jgi:hypothetical protein